MTVLLPPARTRGQRPAPDPARTLDMLATFLILILTIGALYLAREILVPIAIAILLSFVLSPPVMLLRNFGFGKRLAVGSVVFLTFLIAVALGFVLTKQITDLAADAPRYQETVATKFDIVRNFITTNPLLDKIDSVIADMTRVTHPVPPKAQQKSTAPNRPSPNSGSRQSGGPAKPMPVEVVSPPPGVFAVIQTVGSAAASPLATAAFVALFIVFILMQREDLRNRFIRLVGSGDLNRTTVAMNDAANRLSRFYLAQVLLNTGFGAIVAVTLALIGVPSAILWGIVASFMRFIPYIGSIGAALFPVLMGAAAVPGWSLAIETAVLFVTLELVTGQIIEPLVYGHNTGITPIAVVISATFWTWLWGPVGLVLSTPLTVCLVVMGRHVERFTFLEVILGDAPPLTPAETFYQRMLVDDPSEIVDHAETYLKTHSLLDYCDNVAMKALLMAQSDVRRGALGNDRQSQICTAIRELVDDLADGGQDLEGDHASEREAPAAPVEQDEDETEEPVIPAITVPPAWKRDSAVVCVAGRTPLDEAAAHLLADLLTQHEVGVHVEPAASLATNNLSHLAARGPALVILSFLDADLSVAQARFAVRRLRRRIPGVPLVAAFWMAEADGGRTATLCGDVRCDTCVSSLAEAIRLCLERAAEASDSDADEKPAPDEPKDVTLPVV